MAGKEILGQKVYASLKDVPAPVDMVDIFREAKYAPEIVREALAEKDRLGLKYVWMQLGVVSEEAAKLARGRRPHRDHGPLPQDRAWPLFRRDWLDGRQPQSHRQPQAAPVRQGRQPETDYEHADHLRRLHFRQLPEGEIRLRPSGHSLSLGRDQRDEGRNPHAGIPENESRRPGAGGEAGRMAARWPSPTPSCFIWRKVPI